MKKTIKTLMLTIIIGIMLITLTGCANINYEIKLNEDGSGDVSYIIGYNKNFLKSLNVSTDALADDDSLDEMKQSAQEEGFLVTSYEDDNTYGFKATKHMDNISEFNINDTISEGEATNDSIIYEKTFLQTKYSQNASLNLSQPMEDQESVALTNSLFSQMQISYRIELPFKVGENNATTVSEDGKTLEWNLKFGVTNEIKFEAVKNNLMFIVVCVLCCIAVLTIIVIVIVGAKKKKKKALVKEENTNSEEPKNENDTNNQ